MTNIYTAGSWQTNSATLNQFSGSINTAAVKELVVVVGMLQPSQTYVGHIDNIRFHGMPLSPKRPCVLFRLHERHGGNGRQHQHHGTRH